MLLRKLGIFLEAKRHLRYVIFKKKYVNKFKEKRLTLIAKKTSVQEEVDAAKRNVQKIKADVEDWCNKVDKKIDQQLKTEYIETFEQQTESSFLELFQRKYANPLIVGVGLMLLQQLGGNSGMAYYASSIFVKAGLPSAIRLQVMSIIQIPVAIIALLLMDRSGRRPLLLVSASGMCLSCFLIGLSFGFKEITDLKALAPVLALTGFLVVATAFTIGLGGIPWIIMSEKFLINVKAQAGSLVTLVNWSTSWIITYTLNFMMEWSSADVDISFFFIPPLPKDKDKVDHKEDLKTISIADDSIGYDFF
ncbi:General substrate transporter [Corchorus olitorius]|uniref:General substrate transporter n=1 Tax=Corchorus olitorius TaxID=93759 RepID=A0A1R3JW01_9ROSI|nr:General substrate transporter [Corchorus olitorius]